jgi:surfeit locus 1 family protein
MPRRIVPFLVIAALAAALFVRLGFWQLSRLHERRERNGPLQARLALTQAELRSLPVDSAQYRRARVHGTLDTTHELVLAMRSYQGSPGVYLLTPMRIAGSDTAVLVNRGWVYAADGMTVDLQRWRESDTLYSGYADVIPEHAGARAVAPVMSRASERPNLLRRLDREALIKALPYPVAPVYLVASAPDSSKPPTQRVVRLGIPVLDEGPHLGYAFQWFSFATIAIVGAVLVAHRSRAEAAELRVVKGVTHEG